MRYMHPDTHVYFQISESPGGSWVTLIDIAGNNPNVSLSTLRSNKWTTETVAIPDRYSGQIVKFRVWGETTGPFYGNPSATQANDYGIYFDEIEVTDSTELVHSNVTTLTNTESSYLLSESAVGSPIVEDEEYMMQVAPVLGGHTFAYSVPFFVSAVPSATAWRIEYFGDEKEKIEDYEDYDDDGVSNLLERALGGDPTVGSDSSGALMPVGGIPPVGELSNRAVISFQRLSPAPPDITYEVEASADLVLWTIIAKKEGDADWSILEAGAITQEGDENGGLRPVQVADAIHPDACRYLRLRVTASGSN